MILLGAQIHWDGDGTCGFLTNPTLSSNSAQLPSSSALVDTRISLCDSAVSHRHFTPEVRTCPTLRTRNHFI